MKRPAYRDAIAWIAANDNAGADDALEAEAVRGYITVGFVADMFEVDQGKVAADVVRHRMVEAQRQSTERWAMTGQR